MRRGPYRPHLQIRSPIRSLGVACIVYISKYPTQLKSRVRPRKKMWTWQTHLVMSEKQVVTCEKHTLRITLRPMRSGYTSAKSSRAWYRSKGSPTQPGFSSFSVDMHIKIDRFASTHVPCSSLLQVLLLSPNRLTPAASHLATCISVPSEAHHSVWKQGLYIRLAFVTIQVWDEQMANSFTPGPLDGVCVVPQPRTCI